MQLVYSDKPKDAVARKVKTICADAQVYNGRLLELQLQGITPTGFLAEDIARVAVARHLNKYKPGSPVESERGMYAFKRFDCCQWLHYEACLVLKSYEKFQQQSSLNSVCPYARCRASGAFVQLHR